MIQYLWLIPVVMWGTALGMFSVEANKEDSGLRIFIFFIAISIIPIWPFVAKYISKNIIFDALLFDIIACLSFFVGLLLMGAAQKFSIFNWGGLAIVIVGMFMIKLK